MIKNGGHIDLHFFYLNGLQCGLHCFSTRIWVKHPKKPRKWHPTCIYCSLFREMMFDLYLTSIWPLFWPEMTQVWPCKSENGYLVTVECQIIQSHPRMLHFKVPRKHSWFWRSWRSNGGQNEVGSFRRWHIRKIWAKIELCAKKTPNRLKTVTANPHPPLKCPRWNAPFGVHPITFYFW